MIFAPVWGTAVSPPPPGREEGNARFDVAVVGGGLAGLSAAYHLAAASPGIRVVVLERGGPGAGASGRNTGMLSPGVGQSFLALVDRLGAERAGAIYRETLDAVAFARELIGREGIACDLEMTGQLVLARTRTERRRLARQLALMQTLGLPVSALDDAALAAALRLGTAPAGADGDGPAALRMPVAGLLDPAKLIGGLRAACLRRRVRLVDGVAVRDVTGGATAPVRLALEGDGAIVADHVVIATAGYTAGLGLLKGRVLPVQLQVLATAPLPADALAAVGWRGREGVIEARRLFSYFRLTADDRLIFGGGAPRYGWGGRPDDEAQAARPLQRLRRAAEATFAGRIAPALLAPTHAWTGTIGYVLDALPVVGPLPGRPRVIFAGGWCGHGLALSLASGPHVARLCAAQAGDDVRWLRGDPRSLPPRVPSELVRWLAFRGAVAGMSLADRRP